MSESKSRLRLFPEDGVPVGRCKGCGCYVDANNVRCSDLTSHDAQAAMMSVARAAFHLGAGLRADEAIEGELRRIVQGEIIPAQMRRKS